jgi:hypothetical protein
VCSVSFWSLIVFVFCSFCSLIVFLVCFLLIIDSISVLFPFDHWYSFCSVSCFLLIIDSLFVLFPCDQGNIAQRLSMIKRKQNTKTINDQKETEHKDYQRSIGNRTQRLSMIKKKQNTNTINDQKETHRKDYQWSKGNRAQRISMIKRKQNTKIFCFLLIIDSLCVLFPFDHW